MWLRLERAHGRSKTDAVQDEVFYKDTKKLEFGFVEVVTV